MLKPGKVAQLYKLNKSVYVKWVLEYFIQGRNKTCSLAEAFIHDYGQVFSSSTKVLRGKPSTASQDLTIRRYYVAD